MSAGKPWRLLVVALIWASAANAQYWENDPSFAPVLEGIAEVFPPRVVASPGGRCLVVPSYAVNGRLLGNKIVRLNGDGTVDTSFACPENAAWYVLAVYRDERVLATRLGPNSERQVVRLLSNGSLDSAFTPVAVSSVVSSARVLDDGKILVMGYFTKAGGLPRNGLALMSGDGALSTSFVPELSSGGVVAIYGAMPLPDGRFVVAGNFDNVGASGLNRLVRLNADGRIDAAFQTDLAGFTGGLYSLATDGRFLASRYVDGIAQLVRLHASGAQDASFTPSVAGLPSVWGPQQPDGKIYYLTRVDAFSPLQLRRTNSDGTVDPAFAAATAVLPAIGDDGRLFVPDPVSSERSQARRLVSRLRSDGSLDDTFAPRFGGISSPETFLRMPNGKVLVSGSFSFVNNASVSPGRSLVRLNEDGTTDATFASVLAADDFLTDLALQPNGKILAFGTFGSSMPSPHYGIRFNPDGSHDATFAPIGRSILKRGIDAAGRIYGFDGSNQILRRYTADGLDDPSFHSPTGWMGIGGLAVLPDGSIAVSKTEATGRYQILLLDENGAVDTTITSDTTRFPQELLGLVALPDNRLLVYGTSNARFGKTMRFIRLTRTGAVDFVHIGPDSGSQILSSADAFLLAGVLYDLAREAEPAPGTVMEAGSNRYPPFDLAIAPLSGSPLLASLPEWGLRRYTPVSNRQYTFDPQPTILLWTAPSTRMALQGDTVWYSVVGSGLQPLTFQWTKNGVPIAGATTSHLLVQSIQPDQAGEYAVAVGNDFGSVTSPIVTIAVNTTVAPLEIIEGPTSGTAAPGSLLILSSTASGNPVPAFRWHVNGNPVAAVTNGTVVTTTRATLLSRVALPAVSSADAGIYTTEIVGGGTSGLQIAILGIDTTDKIVGTGESVGTDIPHPNGNIFDQVLVQGAAITITADPGQVTRTSFVDLDDDIVQVEFSGAGTLSLVFDAVSGPAKPAKYTQEVLYTKGHAGIVVAGANETTHVSVFSVGRRTAFDPTGGFNILEPVTLTNQPTNNGSPLFQGHSATSYGGVADLAFIAILSTDGKFGGLRTGNANYFATKGVTGVYAPGVTFTGPVYIGDLNAFDNATPMLVIGSSPDTRITGGDLYQENGRAVQVSGLVQLKFTEGGDSHGNAFSAKTNRARLAQDGNDVTKAVVVNPAP